MLCAKHIASEFVKNADAFSPNSTVLSEGKYEMIFNIEGCCERESTWTSTLVEFTKAEGVKHLRSE